MGGRKMVDAAGSEIKKPTEFHRGNARDASQGGWFIGSFLNLDTPQTQDGVSIKWGEHKEGESGNGTTSCKIATTVTVLVSGRMAISVTLHDAIREEILDRPGDYVLFGPQVPHSWRATKDAVIMTIRWPSFGREDIQSHS